jgi:hypothetical protein
LIEPGLLDDLAKRVEEAERKFQAADLDLRLRELDAAKQRQVTHRTLDLNIFRGGGVIRDKS